MRRSTPTNGSSSEEPSQLCSRSSHERLRTKRAPKMGANAQRARGHFVDDKGFDSQKRTAQYERALDCAVAGGKWLCCDSLWNQRLSILAATPRSPHCRTTGECRPSPSVWGLSTCATGQYNRQVSRSPTRSASRRGHSTSRWRPTFLEALTFRQESSGRWMLS